MNNLSGIPIHDYDSVNIWVKRHLEMCDLVSTWSKDPSSKFGCVFTDFNHKPLGYGFNGFPRRFEDTPERWSDRTFKYAHVIHAEENAIINATKSLDCGAIAYVNGCPCSSCMGKLAQAGVNIVWCWQPTDDYLSRWSVDDPATVARECGVSVNFVSRPIG